MIWFKKNQSAGPDVFVIWANWPFKVPYFILSDSYRCCLFYFNTIFLSPAQRVGVCNTSGSGTDLPGQSRDVSETHGPLPQNASLFMGFAFMLTASSECDRLTNKLTSDDEEGEADDDKTRILIHTDCSMLNQLKLPFLVPLITLSFFPPQQITCRQVRITKHTQSPSCRQVEASSCQTSMKNRYVLWKHHKTSNFLRIKKTWD